jgi:hypothetical protein
MHLRPSQSGASMVRACSSPFSIVGDMLNAEQAVYAVIKKQLDAAIVMGQGRAFRKWPAVSRSAYGNLAILDSIDPKRDSLCRVGTNTSLSFQIAKQKRSPLCCVASDQWRSWQH